MPEFGEKIESDTYSLTHISATRILSFIRKELEEYLKHMNVAARLRMMEPKQVEKMAHDEISTFLGSEKIIKAVGGEPEVSVECRMATWRDIYPNPVKRTAVRIIRLMGKILPRVFPPYDERLLARFLLLPYEVDVFTDMLFEDLIADWYAESGDGPPGVTRHEILRDDDLCVRAQEYFNKFNPEFGWYMMWRNTHPPTTRVASTLRVPGNVISVIVKVPPSKIIEETITIKCTVR